VEAEAAAALGAPAGGKALCGRGGPPQPV